MSIIILKVLCLVLFLLINQNTPNVMSNTIKMWLNICKYTYDCMPTYIDFLSFQLIELKL